MLLCEEIHELIAQGKVAPPDTATAEVQPPSAKRRKTAGSSKKLNATGGRVKKAMPKPPRGFYSPYEASCGDPPSRPPMLCTVRSSWLDAQTSSVKTRPEVPEWWGKIPEMLKVLGVTLGEWRGDILDEEPDDLGDDAGGGDAGNRGEGETYRRAEATPAATATTN